MPVEFLMSYLLLTTIYELAVKRLGDWLVR